MDAAEKLSRQLDALNTLPSMNAIVLKFAAIAADPASSADDAVEVLKLDPALAGKALRLANSAYVGIPNSIASLKNAVVLLGLKRIYSLALASGVLAVFANKGPLPFVLENYWRHSVCVGMVGESIAKLLRRYYALDSDDAFTGGLLHDIGKLALGRLAPDRITAAAADSQDRRIPFFQAEESALAHGVVGGLLARRWNFPRHLIDVLTFHHTPEMASAERIVLIVNVADALVHMAGRSTYPGEIAPELLSATVSSLQVQPEQLRAIANEAIHNEKTVESCMQCFQ